MTLALWCGVFMLPSLLCACRQNRNLASSEPAYRVFPHQIPLDDEFTYYDEQRITAIDLAMVPEPTRLREQKPIVHWEMSLQEVLFHALSNAKVIRQGGQFLSPNSSLLRSPDGVPTVYDQSIQSTGVLFGQRGVQAALSEFDTQFTTRMLWGNSSTIQNFNQLGIGQGGTLVEDTAQFQASLQRSLISGGQFGLSHSWNYTQNNTSRLFPSAFDGNLRAEFRQPLLAGAGSEYSRIAGPISDNIQGVTGVQQGMLIANINNTVAKADFEMSATNFLKDIESQYWKLYVGYRTLDVYQTSQQDAEQILQMVEARADAPGGDLSRLVEARDGVLQAKQRVLEARDAVYSSESELRLMMGFSLQTERMIYPIDRPVTAEIAHDWSSSLGSALARRPELRRQKLAIKSAELQLRAAENLNRPRLDFLASGQTNGFGDALLGPRHVSGTTRPFGSAYDRLIRGNETGWNLGVEYSQPLGLRFAGQQVKNNELKLAKAMILLEAQEADILHQLIEAFQKVDKNFLAMQNQEAVVQNADDRLTAAEADLESNKDGRGFLDLDSVNRARDIYAQSYAQLEQARVEYSVSLTEIEYRCGRLLEYHNVILGSGPELAMIASSGINSEASPTPAQPPPSTPPALPEPQLVPDQITPETEADTDSESTTEVLSEIESETSHTAENASETESAFAAETAIPVDQTLTPQTSTDSEPTAAKPKAETGSP